MGHRIGGTKPENQLVVIGVVRDSKYTSVDGSPMPMAWYAYRQTAGVGAMEVELHTFGNPVAILPSVHTVVHGIDPNLPLQRPMTQQAQFEKSYSEQTLFARLAIFFGGLATMLVAIDPATFIAALVGVMLVALAAAFIPARRAASLDPMRALRGE